jgi:S-formylglutathione hydrolase FrmB
MGFVWKTIRLGFYLYVIGLAVYVTFQSVAQRRLGSYEVDFKAHKKECFAGGKDWRYCVHESDFDDPQTLLYVFHGRGEDEHVWSSGSKYTGQIQNDWYTRGGRYPRVVTISFGPTWFITPKMSKKGTGLLDVFKTEVFAKIENHLGRPQRRYLLGESMGGLNALSLAFNMPGAFNKVAAICPPLMPMSPFDGYYQILVSGVRHGMKLGSLFELMLLSRSLVADENEWNQVSPYYLASKKSLQRFPQLYLSTGIKDSYGSFEASQKLAQLISARTSQDRVQWRASSGGHCAVDIPSLAQFFVISS